ncbi:hypothetical protein P376_1761 [Streptomyces sp. HCCB10043]|nr:hypothetical protein P376_1761 [Streptomyces sp. HCCB10043]
MRVEEEDQAGGEHRGDEVAEVGEGGGRDRADHDVTEQPSAQRCHLRENRDAEDIEVLADGEQGARDREDEDPDEVERMLDGGREQFGEHRAIVPVPDAPQGLSFGSCRARGARHAP